MDNNANIKVSEKINEFNELLNNSLSNIDTVDTITEEVNKEAEQLTPKDAESKDAKSTENILNAGKQELETYKFNTLFLNKDISKFKDNQLQNYLQKLKSEVDKRIKSFDNLMDPIKDLKKYHLNILATYNMSAHYKNNLDVINPIINSIIPYDAKIGKDIAQKFKKYTDSTLKNIPSNNPVIKEAFINRNILLRKYIFQNLITHFNKIIAEESLKKLKNQRDELKKKQSELGRISKTDPKLVKLLAEAESLLSKAETERTKRAVQVDSITSKFDEYETDIKRNVNLVSSTVEFVSKSLNDVSKRLIRIIDKSFGVDFDLKYVNEESLSLNNIINECINNINRIPLHNFFNLDQVILSNAVLTMRQLISDVISQMMTVVVLKAKSKFESGFTDDQREQLAKSLYNRSKKNQKKLLAGLNLPQEDYNVTKKAISRKYLKDAYKQADQIIKNHQKEFEGQLDRIGVNVKSHKITSEFTHKVAESGKTVYKDKEQILEYGEYFNDSKYSDVVDRMADIKESNKKWNKEKTDRLQSSMKAENEARIGYISKDSVASLAHSDIERTDAVPNNSGLKTKIKNLGLDDSHVLSRDKLIKNTFSSDHNYKDQDVDYYKQEANIEKSTLSDLKKQLSRLHVEIKSFDNTELVAYQHQLANGLIQLAFHASDSAVATGRLADLNKHPKYEDISATMKHIESSRKGMVEAATTLLQNAGFLVKYIVAQKGVSEVYDKMSSALKSKLENDLRKARLEFNNTGNIATLEKYEYEAQTFMQKMPQSQEFILSLAGSVNNISKDARETLEKISDVEKGTRNGIGKFLQRSNYGSGNLSQRSIDILAANGAPVKTINAVTGGDSAVSEDSLRSVLNGLTSTLKKTLDYPELVASFDVLFRSLGKLILRVINTSDIQFKSLSIINSVLKARLGDTTVRHLQESFLKDMKALLVNRDSKLKVRKITVELFMARGIWGCFNIEKQTLQKFIDNYSKNPEPYKKQAKELFGDVSIANAAIPFINQRDAQFNSYIETIQTLKEFNLKNITSNHIDTLISNASFIIKTLSEELPLKPFKNIKERNKQQQKDSDYKEAENFVITHFKEITGENYDEDNEFHQRELVRLTEKRYKTLNRLKKLDTAAKWGIGFFFSENIRKELRSSIKEGIKERISNFIPTRFKKGWAVGASLFTFKTGYFRNIYDTVQKSHKEFGTAQQKFLQEQKDELLNLEKRKPSKLASAKGSTLNKLDDAVHSQQERNRLLSLINKDESEIPLKDQQAVAELRAEIGDISQQQRDVLLGQEIATPELDPELIKTVNQTLEEGGIETPNAAQKVIEEALKADQVPGELKATRLAKANWLGGIIDTGVRLKNAAERAHNRDLKDSAARATDATNRMTRAVVALGSAFKDAFKRKNTDTPIIKNKFMGGSEVKLGENQTAQESSSGSWLTWLLAGLTALLAMMGVQWTDLVHFWLMLMKVKAQFMKFLASPFKWLINGVKEIIKTPFKWLYHGVLNLLGINPNWWANLKTWFKDGVGGFFKKWLIEPIKNFLKGSWEYLFGGVKKLALAVWEPLKGLVQGLINSAIKGILKLFGWGAELLPDIVKGGAKLGKAALDAGKRKLAELGEKVGLGGAKEAGEAGAKAAGKKPGLLSRLFGGAKNALANNPASKAVIDSAGKLAEQAKSFGENIGETMKKVAEETNSWWGKVKGWVGKAVSFVKGAISTVANTFVKGIEKVKEVGTAIKSKLSECWTAFKNRFDSFKELIKNAIKEAGDYLKSRAMIIIACIPPKIRALCTKLFNGIKALGKAVAQSVAKNAGKAAGKKIPIVGLVFSAIGAYQRIKDGEYVKAILEIVSGICSILPGPGTAASLMIDAGLIAWDTVDIISGKKGSENTPDAGSAENSDNQSENSDGADNCDKVNKCEKEQQGLVSDFIEGIKAIDVKEVAEGFQSKWKELNSMSYSQAKKAAESILNDSEMGDMIESDGESLGTQSAAPQTKQQQQANTLVKTIGADNVAGNVNKTQNDLANSTVPNTDKSEVLSNDVVNFGSQIKELGLKDIDPVKLYKELKDLGVKDFSQIDNKTLKQISESYKNGKLDRSVLQDLIKEQSKRIKEQNSDIFKKNHSKSVELSSDTLAKRGLSGIEIGGTHGSRDLTDGIYGKNSADHIKEGKHGLATFISQYFTSTIWYPSQYKGKDLNDWAAFMSGDSKPYHSFIMNLSNSAVGAEEPEWSLGDGTKIKNKIIEFLGKSDAKKFGEILGKKPADRTPEENVLVFRIISNGLAHPKDYATITFAESNALDGGSKVGDDKTGEAYKGNITQDMNGIDLAPKSNIPNISVNNSVNNVSYNYNYFKNNSKNDVDSFYELAKKGYGVNDKGEVIVKDQKALDSLKAKMGDQFDGGQSILKDYVASATKASGPSAINLPDALANQSSNVDNKLQQAAKEIKEIAKDAQQQAKNEGPNIYNVPSSPAGSPSSEIGTIPQVSSQGNPDDCKDCKTKIDNTLNETKKKLDEMPPDQRAGVAFAMASAIPAETIPAFDTLKNNDTLMEQFGSSVEDTFSKLEHYTYHMGSKGNGEAATDCSGYVMMTLEQFIKSKPTIDNKRLTDEEALNVWKDLGLAPGKNKLISSDIINALSKTGTKLEGMAWKEVKPGDLKEGDILYEYNPGYSTWQDGSRHIMFVHGGYVYESSPMGNYGHINLKEKSWQKKGVRKISIAEYTLSRQRSHGNGGKTGGVYSYDRGLKKLNIFDAIVRATRHARGQEVDGWNQQNYTGTVTLDNLNVSNNTRLDSAAGGAMGLSGNILESIANVPGFGDIATKLVNSLFGGGKSTANDTINRVKEAAKKMPEPNYQAAESEPSVPDVSNMLNNKPNAAQLARDVKSKQNKLEVEQKIQEDNNLKKSVDTITTKKIQEEKEKEIQKHEEANEKADTNYDGTTKVSMSFKEKVKLTLKKMFITSPVIEAAMA